ncbi:hypothetical protein CHL76_09020 [Marinococcus halophilus]|uniref:Uncharacterized protein n=1 Tax=Marinococcus halophilus TaxID=1371 RepID=A0A510Y571_MARHA|nr:hypothetical protein [Marinococcus halophilus]OZT80237.1 hypothetical protein CHL76_09020 [Marinococcus halophilus]GEK58293.1 hypothetical protein MHA01_11980 [Marinococcus halophilus]
MVVSLQHYKIQKALRSLSKALHWDLGEALLRKDRVYLSISCTERHLVDPYIRILQEPEAVYFWEVSEELMNGPVKEVLYVGAASEAFERWACSPINSSIRQEKGKERIYAHSGFEPGGNNMSGGKWL